MQEYFFWAAGRDGDHKQEWRESGCAPEALGEAVYISKKFKNHPVWAEDLFCSAKSHQAVKASVAGFFGVPMWSSSVDSGRPLS